MSNALEQARKTPLTLDEAEPYQKDNIQHQIISRMRGRRFAATQRFVNWISRNALSDDAEGLSYFNPQSVTILCELINERRDPDKSKPIDHTQLNDTDVVTIIDTYHRQQMPAKGFDAYMVDENTKQPPQAMMNLDWTVQILHNPPEKWTLTWLDHTTYQGPDRVRAYPSTMKRLRAVTGKFTNHWDNAFKSNTSSQTEIEPTSTIEPRPIFTTDHSRERSEEPLSLDEEINLIKRVRAGITARQTLETTTVSATERIIQRRILSDAEGAFTRIYSAYLPLIRIHASRYSSLDHDDAMQAGALGLWKAVRIFDERKGMRLSTIAPIYIRGEILHSFRTEGHTIRIPEHIVSALKRMQEIRQKDHNITLDQVAEAMGITVEKAATIETYRRLTNTSADDEMYQKPTNDDVPEIGTTNIFLASMLNHLSVQERELMYRAYGLGHTQSEIAETMGFTVRQVQSKLQRTMQHLREIMGLQPAESEPFLEEVSPPVPSEPTTIYNSPYVDTPKQEVVPVSPEEAIIETPEQIDRIFCNRVIAQMDLSPTEKVLLQRELFSFSRDLNVKRLPDTITRILRQVFSGRGNLEPYQSKIIRDLLAGRSPLLIATNLLSDGIIQPPKDQRRINQYEYLADSLDTVLTAIYDRIN